MVKFCPQGEFSGGLPNGRGEFFYGNGDKALDKYIGDFVDGAVSEFVWTTINKAHLPLILQFSGRGKYFFANGDRYEGEFDNGERNGFGIIFYVSGGRRSGEWIQDKLVGEVIFGLLRNFLKLL